MNALVRLEPTLVPRLRELGIDFFARYTELANAAARDDRFVTFDEIYDDLSSRVLEAMLPVEPGKRNVERYSCEPADVWDALASCRLMVATPVATPRVRGGGFSCLT